MKKNDSIAALCALFDGSTTGWLRGNTHTHTTLSDGTATPENAVDWYDKAGYDFLFITEHEEKLDHPEAVDGIESLTKETLLVMPGLEWKVPFPGGRLLHTVVLGAAPTGVFSSNWNLVQTARYARERDLLLVIAHPYWNGIAYEDLAETGPAVALEVYNNVGQVLSGKGLSRSYWDFLLQNGNPIHGVAADDAHWCWKIPDYGGGWIMVKSRRRSTHAILEAIREGRFYSSCGPHFTDISLQGDTLEVITSPVRSIHFITFNGHSKVEHAVDEPFITSARREIKSFHRYLRIECVDEDGRYAWTNAVMLPES